MRILINDFGGYPFPIQLSKYLSNNGYDVAHTYVSNIATPHGDMKADKNSNLTVIPVVLNSEFKKYSIIGRIKGEYEYAIKLCEIIKNYQLDIFVSANTPLFAQSILLNECKKRNIKFIYWCQDIHSIAIEGYLSKKLPYAGKIIAGYFKRKEVKLLEQSDHVIVIAKSFNNVFNKWGVSQKKLSVIHNWGPINEITLEPKINSWSKKFNLESKFVVLYSGTLGIKHNPQLIADAAQHFKLNKDVMFVVISEGIGAEMLKKYSLENLLVLPYQDYTDLPSALGCADVLVSILEPSAAIFSVPSKVLTYLCTKKPIILSVPQNNLSAQIVFDNEAGLCVEPNNTAGFITSISKLLNDDILREQMGRNGRNYAEENFQINLIAEKFIKIFQTLN